MTRSSKIFPILVSILVSVIVGLTIAIVGQRQASEKSRLKVRLEQDVRHMDVVAERVRTVVDQSARLKEQLGSLEGSWKAASLLFFDPARKADLDAQLANIASTSKLTLSRVESTGEGDSELTVDHLFHVRMSGPLASVPVWAEGFYKAYRLGKIDRISVISPDYVFNKVRVKVTLRLPESRAPESVGKDRLPLDKFDVSIDYLSEGNTISDPVYGSAMEQARQKASELSRLKGDLVDSDLLERKLTGTQRILKVAGKLQEEARVNQTTVMQGLPTLYNRARSSPMGSVAMLVQGTTVKFPEVTVDD